jgi:butyrate kinase
VVVGPLYQKVLEQSVTSPAVNVAFTRAMGALILAATGKPNIVALQSGLAALLEAMTLTQNDLDALQALLVLTGMDELVTLPAP